MQKIARSSSGKLTLNEANQIVDLFSEGDYKIISEIVSSQSPKERKLPARYAELKYTLFSCPSCNSERIFETCKIFEGKRGVDAEEFAMNRDIPESLSLQNAIKSPKTLNIFRSIKIG